MKTIICVIAVALFSACATVSPRDAMQADVDQAVSIIGFEAMPEKGIPPAVMRAAGCGDSYCLKGRVYW